MNEFEVVDLLDKMHKLWPDQSSDERDMYRVRLPNFEHPIARATLNALASQDAPPFEHFEAAYPDPNRMELAEQEAGVAHINAIRRQLGWAEKPFNPTPVRVYL